MSSRFVLDNSVTMRWFFDAGAHPYADGFLRDLASSARAASVPIIWRYEVSSVLVRAQTKSGMPAQDITNFLAELGALPVDIDPESGRRVLSDVHRLAIAYRLTSYDAAYLELAQRRNLPLATLDAELIDACKAAGVRLV